MIGSLLWDLLAVGVDVVNFLAGKSVGYVGGECWVREGSFCYFEVYV